MGVTPEACALEFLLRRCAAWTPPSARCFLWKDAAYIWVTNLCFGLLSTFVPDWLTARTGLARAVLLSQSLAEFWARRWNLAFSEMTATAVYRPLSGGVGRGPALVAAFAVSGLLHEMAISVPVRAAYGLPLLYFVLHGGLVLVERMLGRAGRPLQGGLGRAWTILWVAGPLPILFHRPFLGGVLWPLIGIEGA